MQPRNGHDRWDSSRPGSLPIDTALGLWFELGQLRGSCDTMPRIEQPRRTKWTQIILDRRTAKMANRHANGQLEA